MKATAERHWSGQVWNGSADLAAEGQIQVVLIYSPDRLSRKYAYQILLIEEFARQGVETLFVKAPQGDSVEDQLLVQFQGMIAEYERAQILERSRRGKRHRAQAGEVSVLGGAPYGYRYLRKTADTPAAYVVEESEARVVVWVYEMYTVDGLSIAEITRRLNAAGIPTRNRNARWERSVVWAMLRNPAYRGAACFGKTRISTRTRVIRHQRRCGITTPYATAGHERPREEWIEIPVPALCNRRDLCPGSGTSSRKSDTLTSAHHRAQCGAGPGQLCEMWLCFRTHIDADQCTQDSLLQMHRLRRLAQARRPGLR